MSVKRFYEKGETIFLQSSPSNCAYIIESGTVEISDLNDGNKVATAIAYEYSVVHVLDKASFDALSKNNPEALMPIMKVLTFRLRETLKQLNDGYKMPGSNRRDKK